MATATSQTEQPQADFKLSVKLCLLQRDMKVKELAGRIRKSVNNTSIAINHPSMFPGIKELIREELGLSS